MGDQMFPDPSVSTHQYSSIDLYVMSYFMFGDPSVGGSGFPQKCINCVISVLLGLGSLAAVICGSIQRSWICTVNQFHRIVVIKQLIIDMEITVLEGVTYYLRPVCIFVQYMCTLWQGISCALTCNSLCNGAGCSLVLCTWEDDMSQFQSKRHLAEDGGLAWCRQEWYSTPNLRRSATTVPAISLALFLPN